MYKSNSKKSDRSSRACVVFVFLLLFSVMVSYAQTVVLSPIVYGKTATFSTIISDSLPDKIFTVSRVMTSCPCITAQFIRTSRGTYTINGTITTVDYGKGLQEKKLFIRTNDWNSPVRTVTVRYFVIEASEVLPIASVIPENSQEYYELQEYLTRLYAAYGEAISITFSAGTPRRFMIRTQVYNDIQFFKLSLITELMQKYSYLDGMMKEN